MADYTAQIVLTAKDNASAVLKTALDNVNSLNSSLAGSAGPAGNASGALGGVASAASKASGEIVKATAAGSGLSSSLGTVISLAGAATAYLGALAIAAGAGIGLSVFKQLTDSGFEFNRQMEVTRVGIAGLLMGTREWTTANGQVASTQDTMTVSLVKAREVQADLVQWAQKTPAAYMDLVEAFRTGYAPAIRQGVTDTEQLTRITVAASAAVAALGLENNQLATNMRSMFTGRQGPYDQLNRALGITKESLEAARKSAEGVGGYLEKKLAPFMQMLAVESENYATILSNVKDKWQQFAGEVSKPIFDVVKSMLRGAGDEFGKFQNTLSQVSGIFAGLLEKLWPAIQALGEFAAEGLLAFAQVVDAASPLIPVVTSLLELSASLVKNYGVEAVAIGTLFFAGGQLFNLFTALVPVVTGLFGAISSAGSLTAALSGAIGGLTGGLGASLAAMTATTGGTFALIAAVGIAVGAIAALVSTWSQWRDEVKKADEAYGTLKDNMLMNLDRMAKAHPEVKKQVEDLARRIQNTSGDNTVALNKLNNEYVTLSRGLRVVAGMKDAGGEVRTQANEKEARKAKALGDAYDQVKQTLLLKKDELTAPTGLEARIVKIRETWEREIARLRKKFGEDSDLIALAQQNLDLAIAAEQNKAWEKLKADAAAHGRTYTSIVTTTFSGITAYIPPELAKLPPAVAQELAKLPFMFPPEASWQEAVKKAVDTVKASFAPLPETVSVYLHALPNLFPPSSAWEVGIAGALDKIKERIGGWTTTVQNLVTGGWNAMAGFFDSAFAAVIMGDLDGLKQSFEKFGEGLVKTFSMALSDMVQQWLLAKLGIERNPVTGGFKLGSGPGDSYDGLLGTNASWLGLGVSGLAGYGIGSMVGGGGAGNRFGGAAGALGGYLLGSTASIVAGVGSGLGLGAAAGSVVPVIGTIVGAIIGAIIGGLFNSNTESKVAVTGSDYSSRGASQDAVGDSILQTKGSLAGQTLDIFRKAGVGDMAGQARWINGILANTIQSMTYEVHAGSAEDLQADMKRLLGTEVPKLMLRRLFGQTETGEFPELPGIKGVPGFVAGSFDSGAPIPRMLEGLGFTAKKIGEIAGLIDQRAPDEVLKYLDTIVGVVVGFRDLSSNFAKSADQIRSEIAASSNKSAVDTFRESADQIKQLAGELSLYSGDEAIQRAQELIQLGDQRYQAEVQALTALKALADSIAASVAGQIEGMRKDLVPDAQLGSYYQGIVEQAMAELAGATTADQIKALTEKIQNAVAGIWSWAGQKGGQNDDLFGWLQGILTQMESLANERIKKLGDDIVSTNEGLADAMEQAKKLFTDISGTALPDTKTSAETAAAGMDRVASAAVRLEAVFNALADSAAGVSTGGGDRTLVRLLRANPSLLVARTA